MMYVRKTDEEKRLKQQDMEKFETRYVALLAKNVEEKRAVLKEKYPNINTLFEGWLYGVYIAILDNQILEEKAGKLYFIFDNISEAKNKYKLSYSINDDHNCVFETEKLQKLPKTYNNILKRNKLDIKKPILNVAELICANRFKLDNEAVIYHNDNNNLNNKVKNIFPLEKSFIESQEKVISKANQQIPEKYKLNITKKAKDVVKMEYRACDLYYNHKLPIEKIAITLRNRLNKAAVKRTVILYPQFKKLFSDFHTTQRSEELRD